MRTAVRFLQVVLSLILVGTVASGRVIHVDASNPNCPGSGTSMDPFCRIQDAIVSAAAGDTVLVAPGTYLERIDFLGKAITVTSSAGARGTVIDGGGAGSVVSFLSAESRSSVLSGFTIRGGAADEGGGIRCVSSSPTIRENIVTGNTASGIDARNRGGGIFCVSSTALIEDNLIHDNVAAGLDAPGRGGGISSLSSAVTIANNTIIDNRVVSSGGVATSLGGGIYANGSDLIRDNLIARNTAFGRYFYPGCQGGGIFLAGASATVTGNTIVLNEADCANTYSGSYGAGIFCAANLATITNNVLAGNVSKGADTLAGGGLFLSGTATLANNTITRNAAGGIGDGLWSDDGSNVQVTNTVLWGNLPVEVGAAPSAVLSVTYSDVRGGYPGTGNINADPLFVDPASGDLRIDCLSPCAEAGTSNPGVALPAFDHSGLDLRTIGTIDIGADEVGTSWSVTAPPTRGAPIAFTATANSFQNGNLSEVYLSLGNGSQTGGLLVPSSGGRRLGLEADGLLLAWIGAFPPLRRVSLNGCAPGASTQSFTVPASVPVGVQVFFAGVSWDLTTGTVVSISPTVSETIL